MIPRYDAHIASPSGNYGLVSPMESNTTNKAQSKALTFEDFKTLGFEPVNEQILRGTDRIYLYFHAEKAYIMAPINVLTEQITTTSRNFICFEASSSDSLALLYREKDLMKDPFYKTILQDGTQMQGKGEYPIDQKICRKTEDEIEALTKIPLSEQLIKLGFSEVPCNQQIFQRTQRERISLIQHHESCISGTLKGLEWREKFYDLSSEKDLAEFEKIKTTVNKTVLMHQMFIEQLKNEKELHMQVFTKIIPNDPLKIFMVILKDGVLEDISTTIHRSKYPIDREIKGCIISADFGEHKNQSTAPKFELVDAKGEKSKVSFRHGSNTHLDYFHVNCEPM